MPSINLAKRLPRESSKACSRSSNTSAIALNLLVNVTSSLTAPFGFSRRFFSPAPKAAIPDSSSSIGRVNLLAVR